MLFAILGWDSLEGTQKRPLHRDSHRERLTALEKDGKLVLAGPFSDGTGSLIVIKAESLAEAEAFAQEDPYVTHGIFSKIEIHPFHQVLP